MRLKKYNNSLEDPQINQVKEINKVSEQLFSRLCLELGDNGTVAKVFQTIMEILQQTSCLSQEPPVFNRGGKLKH